MTSKTWTHYRCYVIMLFKNGLGPGLPDLYQKYHAKFNFKRPKSLSRPRRNGRFSRLLINIVGTLHAMAFEQNKNKTNRRFRLSGADELTAEVAVESTTFCIRLWLRVIRVQSASENVFSLVKTRIIFKRVYVWEQRGIKIYRASRRGPGDLKSV